MKKLHKFLVENTGTVFYYDNHFNSLLDRDGNKLSLPHQYTTEYVESTHARNLDSNKVIRKSNAPVMIKITLGQKCNFSCGYCSQTELGDNNPEAWKGSKRAAEIEKAASLVEKMKTTIDFRNLKRIELWGGETLIYWQEIQLFMEAFDREGLIWYIPTNGSLLKMEHVEYFKSRKGTVCMGISHDGYAHEVTRDKDFLDDKVEVIRACQQSKGKIQFSFNPVISKENYDLFRLDAFFKEWCDRNGLDNIAIMMELITVYNLAEVRGDSISYALRNDTLEEYGKILKRFLSQHAQQFRELGSGAMDKGDLLPCSLFELGFGVIPYAKQLRQEEILHAGSNCQADSEYLLTVDTSGNVKTCQNVGKEFVHGTIDDFSLVGVVGLDTNKVDRCQTCRVKFLCNSGCPIRQSQEVFDTNCALYKVHFGAIQDAAFEYIFNSPVKYLGME